MLKAIDFTDVLEVYRRNEKARDTGHCNKFMCCSQYPHKDVEMKSPRYWALQPYIIAFIETIITVEMKSPETLGIATFQE